MRTAELSRNTKETQIRLSLNLDGRGTSSVKTGVGFFDHMALLQTTHPRKANTLTAKRARLYVRAKLRSALPRQRLAA